MDRLDLLRNALLTTGAAVYQYHHPHNAKAPYIVWAEDGENAFLAGNRHSEAAIQGTIDLYTSDAADPLRGKIPQAIDPVCAWRKNSTQYEEETGLIHDEWIFEV